jgi:3-oxoacyl-[acyl-carrier-protein] synthase I
MESERIVVGGIGMVTSLGLDANTCCAAARALISRAVAVDWLNSGSGRLWGSESLAGHAVRMTNGFVGLGKLVALGSLALRDLMSRAHLSAEDLRSTGLFVNLSDKQYEDASRSDETANIHDTEGLPSATWRKQTDDVIPILASTCGWVIAPANQRRFYGGHAGFVQALDAAASCINQGMVKHCIVGGIDSLVEPTVLEAANAQRALKAEGRAVGFMPGEAAAFLLLRSARSGHLPGTLNLAVTGTAVVEVHECNGESATAGKALAQAIARVAPKERAFFLGDLNGEESRAMEWGHAAVHLRQQFHDGLHLDLWTPAQHFGEVGAAAGPVAACLGMRGLEKGYAPAPSFVVWLSSGSGLKSAFSIARCN